MHEYFLGNKDWNPDSKYRDVYNRDLYKKNAINVSFAVFASIFGDIKIKGYIRLIKSGNNYIKKKNAKILIVWLKPKWNLKSTCVCNRTRSLSTVEVQTLPSARPDVTW